MAKNAFTQEKQIKPWLTLNPELPKLAFKQPRQGSQLKVVSQQSYEFNVKWGLYHWKIGPAPLENGLRRTVSCQIIEISLS